VGRDRGGAGGRSRRSGAVRGRSVLAKIRDRRGEVARSGRCTTLCTGPDDILRRNTRASRGRRAVAVSAAAGGCYHRERVLSAS
jgi:hypothetical protein